MFSHLTNVCKILQLCGVIFLLALDRLQILRCSFRQCGWPFANWSSSKLEKAHRGHMILSIKQLILAGTCNTYSCVLLLDDFILNMFSCNW